MQNRGPSNFAVGVVLVGIILAAIAVLPFKIVSAGNVGVQVTFGAVNMEPLPEGFHFVNPLSQVHEVSVRADKASTKSVSASKDLQQITTDVTTNYHVSPEQAPNFYKKLPSDYEEVIITPAVEEVMKAVIAHYTAEELITKRPEVSDQIRLALTKRVANKSFGSIAVDDISITNFSFSKSFTDAVEAKQEAQQRSAKAENDLVRIKVEGEQAIVTAKAQAESLRVQREAITPELLKLKSLENDAAAIKKWDGKLPSTTGGAVPFVNVTK